MEAFSFAMFGMEVGIGVGCGIIVGVMGGSKYGGGWRGSIGKYVI